jgi:hypothetical protein
MKNCRRVWRNIYNTIINISPNTSVIFHYNTLRERVQFPINIILSRIRAD